MSLAKKIVIAAVAFPIVASVAFVIFGWYLSNLIRDGGFVPEHEEPELDLEVAELNGDTIVLRKTSETDETGDWIAPSNFGLLGDGRYNRVGRVVGSTADTVEREFTVLSQAHAEGERVRLDSFYHTGDPLEAHNIPFDEIRFSSPLGYFPAWRTEGESQTWAIFVHGKGASRHEALRILPVFHEASTPSLVITYRNDEGLHPNPDGFYRYGLTEWRDLEGAVSYALNAGATDVVLVGFSMGGATVVSFLYESPLAENVRAVVLDSPMLDFGDTVDLGIKDRGYPAWMGRISKDFSTFRFDIDWEAMNYLSRVDELEKRILLFHGDQDDIVPIHTSEYLAQARPDIVRYVRVEDARHVLSWNTDRDKYETALRGFLSEVLR